MKKVDKLEEYQYTIKDVAGKKWKVTLGIKLPQDEITTNIDFNNHPAWGHKVEDYAATSDTSYFSRYKNLKIGRKG